MKCQIAANLFYTIFILRKDASKPVIRAYHRNAMSNTKLNTRFKPGIIRRCITMLEIPTYLGMYGVEGTHIH